MTATTNTDYTKHTGLIHTFAKKGYARLMEAKVVIDYEDVFQQMTMTYVKAAQAFDAEKGVGFGAYLGRAIWNEFNRYAEKELGLVVECGMVSADAIKMGGEDDVHLYDVVESEERTPEENLDRKQQMVRNIRRLNPTAKFLVAQLMSPSQELEAAFDAAMRRSEQLKAEGKIGRLMNSTMTLGFIAEHFGIKPDALREAKSELQQVYGLAGIKL